MKPYTASDFRFTQKVGNLYVISLACPRDGTASVHALGLAGEVKGQTIQEVSLLGSSQKVEWLQTTGALNLRLPITKILMMARFEIVILAPSSFVGSPRLGLKLH